MEWRSAPQQHVLSKFQSSRVARGHVRQQRLRLRGSTGVVEGLGGSHRAELPPLFVPSSVGAGVPALAATGPSLTRRPAAGVNYSVTNTTGSAPGVVPARGTAAEVTGTPAQQKRSKASASKPVKLMSLNLLHMADSSRAGGVRGRGAAVKDAGGGRSAAQRAADRPLSSGKAARGSSVALWPGVSGPRVVLLPLVLPLLLAELQGLMQRRSTAPWTSSSRLPAGASRWRPSLGSGSCHQGWQQEDCHRKPGGRQQQQQQQQAGTCDRHGLHLSSSSASSRQH